MIFVANRIARADVLQPDSRADVACENLADLFALIGVHLHQAANPLRLACAHIQHRIAGLQRSIHFRFHPLLGLLVGAVQQDFIAPGEGGNLFPGDLAFHASTAHSDNVAEHLDLQLAQEQFGQRAGGHSRRRFARRGSLQRSRRRR